jgi:hypothetical protein
VSRDDHASLATRLQLHPWIRSGSRNAAFPENHQSGLRRVSGSMGGRTRSTRARYVPSEWAITVAYGRQRAERGRDAGQRFRRSLAITGADFPSW